jgi:hypothetical protein
MWMCDSCQEINDDAAKECSRCHRPYVTETSADILAHLHPQSTPLPTPTVPQPQAYTPPTVQAPVDSPRFEGIDLSDGPAASASPNTWQTNTTAAAFALPTVSAPILGAAVSPLLPGANDPSQSMASPQAGGGGAWPTDTASTGASWPSDTAVAGAQSYSQPSTPRSRPGKLWLYIAWVVIAIIDGLPVLIFREQSMAIIVSLGAAAALCYSGYFVWRDIDLMKRGVQVMGTVTSVDFNPSYDRYGIQRGGTYYTNVEYSVDGIPYSTRSEYGSSWQTYEAGQPIVVWYDSGAPDIAEIGARAHAQTYFILIAGLGATVYAYMMR